MTDRFAYRILNHLADSRYQPQQIRDLARDLGVDDDDYADFEKAVSNLIDEGQAVFGARDTVVLPPLGRQMIGTFRKHERGFGFIMPDPDKRHGHGDLFVPNGETGDAMTGDRVRAKVLHRPGRAGRDRSPYTGRIIEIIQRADKRYVGNLVKRQARGPKSKAVWIVEVDNNVMHEPVIIRDPHAKNASEGDKVVVELIQYPTDDEQAEGVITEVLGEKGEPEVETVAVMRAHGLADQFPEKVVADARRAAQAFDDDAIPDNREDLTGTFICTIDPPDARDFDDAISIKRLDPKQHNGVAWELGVHIADVSHFVTAGSDLDEEAYQRGNSTYLPRRVVPMLPELLSNGVCSLQEGVNRFAKSAIMQYDEAGNVKGRRFANAVIRSAKRLTYLEAQALIDGDVKEARKHAKTDAKYPQQLIEALKLMNELATTIRKRRLKQGMIVLGLPEVELVFDDSGRVVDAESEDTSFTHTIIEMFMVEANEAAAELFDQMDVPMIRRVHPDPDAHDMGDLRQFARVAGYNIPARPNRKELQQLLDAVRGKPQQQAVHFAVLRTLSKAEYAPVPVGHFALASEHYTHFTSPIRRYTDLVVHRAIDAYFEAYGDHTKNLLPKGKRLSRLASDVSRDKRVPDEGQLAEIGRHCSSTERNSEGAERELRQYLVMELLATHLGDDYPGTVTGVTSQGVFIQIDKYLVDGFIRATDLPGPGGERWRLNPNSGGLVAQRSGRVITIGDRFTVRIAKVNPQARRMDLVIIEEHSPKKQKRKQGKGARKGHQTAMKMKRAKGKRR